MITLNIKNVFDFVPEQEIMEMKPEVDACMEKLLSGTGEGNDFLGWVNLPSKITEADFTAIEKTAHRLREKSEIIIVIGIGGSYLGAKAVNDEL